MTANEASRALEQNGVLLNCEPTPFKRRSVRVPRPPADLSTLDPRRYAHLLPGASPEHLRLGRSPISELLGPDELVVLIYDSRTPYNDPSVDRYTSSMEATRLSATLETGFGTEVWGPALVFYAAPGRDLSVHQFGALDSLIYGPVMDMWGDGRQPTMRDYQRWAGLYQAGKFH